MRLRTVSVVAQFRKRYAYIEIGKQLRVRTSGSADFVIALYGKPYIQAAKDTWGLFTDRGIDALVNDQLVSMSKLYATSYLVVLSHQIHSFDVGWLCRWFIVLAFRIPVSAVHSSCV